MDSRRGYTRKRLQYLYYDKENQMVLMTRTDVTDIYLEQKRQNKLLQRALMQAQTDPLTGLYNQAVKDMIAEQMCIRDSLPIGWIHIGNIPLYHLRVASTAPGQTSVLVLYKTIINILCQVQAHNQGIGRTDRRPE